MTIRAKFTGAIDAEGKPREYLQGIPARDLDEDEWKAFTNEQRAEVRGSAIYRTKTDAEMSGAHGSESTSTSGAPAAVDLHSDDESGGGE